MLSPLLLPLLLLLLALRCVFESDRSANSGASSRAEADPLADRAVLASRISGTSSSSSSIAAGAEDELANDDASEAGALAEVDASDFSSAIATSDPDCADESSFARLGADSSVAAALAVALELPAPSADAATGSLIAFAAGCVALALAATESLIASAADCVALALAASASDARFRFLLALALCLRSLDVGDFCDFVFDDERLGFAGSSTGCTRDCERVRFAGEARSPSPDSFEGCSTKRKMTGSGCEAAVCWPSRIESPSPNKCRFVILSDVETVNSVQLWLSDSVPGEVRSARCLPESSIRRLWTRPK